MRILFPLIAVLLTTLMLSIPIASAAALTATLRGSAGIENMAARAPIETVNISVTIQLAPNEYPDGLPPGQVKYQERGTTAFKTMTCAKNNGTGEYNCNDQFLLVNAQGTKTYDFYLFDKAFPQNKQAALAKRENVQLAIDQYPPQITTLSIAKSGNILSINYAATDYGTTATDTTKCLGIQNIDFYEGNPVTGTKIVLPQPEGGAPGTCSITGFVTHTTTSQGNIQICAVATDYGGTQQNPPKCASILIDTAAPTFANFTLRQRSTNTPLTFVGATAVPATLSILIADDNLDTNKVTANLATLGGGTKVTRTSISQVGDYYKATWDANIQASTTTCNVIFNATDTQGNTGTTTETCSYASDILPPAIARLPQNLILGKQANFTIDFTEAGIGMNTSEAYLDLAGIGLAVTKATSCTKASATIWTCRWEFTIGDHNLANKTLLVSTRTQDDLGNKRTSPYTQTLAVNALAQGPQITSISTPEIANTRGLPNATKDTIIKYHVTASSHATLYADFRALAGPGAAATQPKPGACRELNNTGQKECIFEIVITKPGPYTANITFISIDAGGNYDEQSRTLAVFGTSTLANPNYWDIVSDCTPTIIDRQMASLLDQRIYCKLALKKTDPRQNIEVISTQLDNANAGTKLSSMLTGDGVTIFNNGNAKRQPYVSFTIARASFRTDTLTFTYPLLIHSQLRVGNGYNYTSNPEQDNVTVNIGLTNSLIGDISARAQKNIDNAIDDVDDLGHVLKDATKVLRYAEKVCQVRSTLMRVVTALHAATTLVGLAYDYVNYPPAKAALRVTYQSMCQGSTTTQTTAEGQGGFTGFINNGFFVQLCAVTNCQATQDYWKGAGIAGSTGTGFSSAIGGGIRNGQQTVFYPGNGWFDTCGNPASTGDPAAQSPSAYVETSTGKSTSTTGSITNIQGEAVTGLAPASNPPPRDPNDPNPGQPIQGCNQVDVKNSLIYSIMNLCLPGIVHNLDKYQQVRCTYATCLINDVREFGERTGQCSIEKHEATCSLVVGEVFALTSQFGPMSWLNALQYKLAALVDIMTSPVKLVTSLFGMYCKRACTGTSGSYYGACVALKLLDQIGQVVKDFKDVEKMKDEMDYLKPTGSSCDTYEDVKQKYKASIQ